MCVGGGLGGGGGGGGGRLQFHSFPKYCTACHGNGVILLYGFDGIRILFPLPLNRFSPASLLSPARKRPLEQQFEGEDDLKRRRTDSDAPPSTLRVLIRNSVRRWAVNRVLKGFLFLESVASLRYRKYLFLQDAGGIIGRSGDNIKRLRKQVCPVIHSQHDRFDLTVSPAHIRRIKNHCQAPFGHLYRSLKTHSQTFILT